MDFAGFLESFAKFQSACMPIHNDGNGWAQSIAITQSFPEAGVEFVQIIDHISNRIPFYQKTPLAVGKTAQQ